jgi:hypothetical protein
MNTVTGQTLPTKHPFRALAAKFRRRPPRRVLEAENAKLRRDLEAARARGTAIVEVAHRYYTQAAA